MNINDIKELIKALDDSSITSLKVKSEEESIELKKGDFVTTVAQEVSPVRIPVVSAEKEEGHFVRSPIVGIAYKSSKPGAEPFVQVGQEVTVGQTLCMVEAMKMFNEIKADSSGVISEILFEDGKLVEFDMPLVKIEVKE